MKLSKMGLYSMELYKICRKKMLWVLGALMILWLGFYFAAEIIGSERSTVNGVTYSGYAAIQKDREITKEYEGILTDGKVDRIIDEYGFPAGVEEYRGWKDANYLMEFVTDNLSDGELTDWDSYVLPTQVISLKDSLFAEYVVTENGEEGIHFGYGEGWKKFFDFMNLGVEMLMVWLIAALAPVFCEEKQVKTYPLLFTTEYGKSEDVRAKIVSAVGLAAVLYAGFVAGSLLLFQGVFGIFDTEMTTGIVLNYSSYWEITEKNMIFFLTTSLVRSFTAVLMMAALSLWISAQEKTVFASVLTALAVFCFPILLLLTVGGRFYYFVAAWQPFMMANYSCQIETWGFFRFYMAIAVTITILGVYFAAKGWKKTAI